MPTIRRLMRKCWRPSGCARLRSVAYWSTPSKVNDAKVERVAERAAASQGVVIRSLRMQKFAEEVEMIWNLYNSAWTATGFRSDDARGISARGRRMKQILKRPGAGGRVEGRPWDLRWRCPYQSRAQTRRGQTVSVRLFKFCIIND